VVWVDNDNPHVVKEEDMEYIDHGEKDKNADHDAYNADRIKKDHFFGKSFINFFRVLLIIIAFLIAAILTLKFIFFRTMSAKNSNNKMQNIKSIRDVTIKDNKRFSPSVFDYISKNKNSELKKKFNEGTSRANKVDHGKNSHNDYRGTSHEYGNISRQIPSKMIVFLETSYKKTILKIERGETNKTSTGKTIRNLTVTGLRRSAFNNIVIPDGTVVNAYTKYKIFSYDTGVPIIAILLNNFTYLGKVTLKKGDKFFGTVSVKHSLNRLNISFDKIIKTNGHSINIKAIAMMPDGSGGIKGNVHYPYNIGSAIMSLARGIIGATSIFIGGGSGTNSSKPYTFQNQIRENVASNELNQAENGINSYDSSYRNMASITLPKNTPIKIMFLKPLYKKTDEKNRAFH